MAKNAQIEPSIPVFALSRECGPLKSAKTLHTFCDYPPPPHTHTEFKFAQWQTITTQLLQAVAKSINMKWVEKLKANVKLSNVNNAKTLVRG